MKITRSQLATTIAKQLGKTPSKQLAAEIAAYLIAERRTKEIDSLLRDVMQARTAHGIMEADAISAFPLTLNIKQEIKQLLDAQTLVLNEKIDSRVLGGVRVESNDTLLDLTVRSRLNKLKLAKVA